MDCSQVESEQQLAEVFTAYFPHPYVYELFIWNNYNIKVLRAGVFGNVIMRGYDIYGGSLEEVEAGALSGGYNSTLFMVFSHTNLAKFPFEELHSFEYLYNLIVLYNDLSSLPDLSSSSLRQVYLDRNPFTLLSATTFAALPHVNELGLEECELRDILPGTVLLKDKLE